MQTGNQTVINQTLQLAVYNAIYGGYAANQPYLNYVSYIKTPMNWTSSEVTDYIIYYFYWRYLQAVFPQIHTPIRIIIAFFGFFGYILEAILLWTRPEFKTVSFLYHKALVAIEMPACFCTFCMYLAAQFPQICASYGVTYFIQIICYTFENLLGAAGTIVTLFTCIERCVALWLPTKFHVVNHRKVALSAIALSLGYSLMYLPEFWRFTITGDGVNISFSKSSSDFDLSPDHAYYLTVRNTLNTIRGFIIMGLSVIVVLGLIRYAKKHQATASHSNDTANSSPTVQLSILLLSCSIPIMINSILSQVGQALSGNLTGGNAVKVQIPSDANIGITRYVVYEYTKFISNISFALAHDVHFYLYVLCTEIFRNAAKEKFHFCCKYFDNGRSITPTISMSSISKANGNP